MSNLTGKKPGSSYKQILNVGDLNVGLEPVTTKALTDGEGNASPLKLSRTKLDIGSHVDVEALLTSISQGLTNLSTNLEALRTGAPEVLDTITELAAALGNNPNAITSILTALTGKVPTSRQVSGRALSADITADQLSSDLEAPLDLVFHMPSTTLTLTNQSLAVQPFGGFSAFRRSVDTRKLNYVRVYAYVTQASNSVNDPGLVPQYSIDGGNNWITVGSGTGLDQVSLAVTIVGTVSNYVQLPAQAKGINILFRIGQKGGDGIADPGTAGCGLQFKA